jgi:signal transduction histidine kinase
MSAYAAASADTGRTPPLSTPRGGRWGKRIPVTPVRVVVVDDDPGDRLIIRRYLTRARSCRFSVRECDDPDALREILDEAPVDVILMDQRLGQRYGTDVIRQIGGNRAVAPSILLTGSDDASIDDLAMLAGAAEHLNKADLSDRVLERTIRYVIKGHSDQLELRRQSEQLQAAWNEAAQANRAKSVFLAAMSHELRTPLNAIIGFSTMLLTGKLARRPTRVLEYARCILEGGQQLLHLVDNLLDIARIEAGQFLLGDDALDLPRLFEEVVQANEPLAGQHDVTVRLLCPADLPEVRSDRAGLHQIVLNLLSNATKYTLPGGEVVLTAELDDGGIRIEIRDSGIGMTEEEIESALRPFVRVRNNAYVRSTAGSGLGLAIVRSLTEQLGLLLAFDSKPGSGTTATVTIPAERLSPPPETHSP